MWGNPDHARMIPKLWPSLLSHTGATTLEVLTYENALIQNLAVVHRPNARTPSTFRWHLRWACASIKKLRDIHSNVDGMEVQQGTWNRLKDLLPCEACVAGKLRKFHHTRPSEFFPIESLAARAQSTNSIDEVGREQNDIVSVDWGIVLSECRKKNRNVREMNCERNWRRRNSEGRIRKRMKVCERNKRNSSCNNSSRCGQCS